MKRPTTKELLEALLIIAICALLYVGYTDLVGGWEARGGTLVKTIGGYECVALERK